MEKTIKIIRELKSSRIIKDYAIGGGIAVLYYVEPILTYDLDIFFIPVEDNIDVLSPIYKYFKEKGYKTQKEHILIEGVPVQFIPVYNELVKEAVESSVEAKYGRMKTKVIRAEYLAAIMLQTDRPKDRERILKLWEQTDMDKEFLKHLLKKHSLYNKYKILRKMYDGQL